MRQTTLRQGSCTRNKNNNDKNNRGFDVPSRRRDEKEISIKNSEDQKSNTKAFGNTRKATSSGYRNSPYKWQSGKSGNKTSQTTTGRGNADKKRDANKQKQPIVEFPTSESEQEHKYNGKNPGSKFIKEKADRNKKTNDRGKKGGKAINYIEKKAKPKNCKDQNATSSNEDDSGDSVGASN